MKVQAANIRGGSPMTRYFFDVREGEFIAPDEEGMALRSAQEALQIARVAAAEIASDVLPAGKTDRVTVEIRDESKRIGRVTLSVQTEAFDT